MIINGNTFAYGAFQLDTRPLYIECEFDVAQQKYVPVQDYTLQQITEAAKTRPVFVKVSGSIAPLVEIDSVYARFMVYVIGNPLNQADSYTFVDAKRFDSKWEIDVQDV